MRYIGIIILLVLCLTLLLFTGCRINTDKPETPSGNLENQEDFDQSSNNSQGSSTGSVEEPVIEDTEEPAEEPAEETVTVYPQKWATGDGTAENPWANDCIQKAYNAVPAGGTIFLGAGYYTLGTVLNIEGKRCNIVGEGMENTFIVTSMEHTTAIRVVDDYCTLKGFTLDADSQALDAELMAIKLDTGNYMTIEDIEVKNAGYAGIEYADIDYAMISNIYLHDNNWMGMHSAHLDVTQGRHNTFQDIYTWNHTHHGFDDGVAGATDCDNTYDNIHAWNCGQDGLNFWGMNGGTISNCSAWGCTEYGLNIGHSKNLNIYDSSFYLNDATGIRIAYSNNITFNNVTSKNNNTGIAIEDCSNIVLTFCQSYDDRDTPLQRYGIQLIDTNTGISLSNCKLSPNATGEIYNPTGAVLTVITEKREFLLLSL